VVFWVVAAVADRSVQAPQPAAHRNKTPMPYAPRQPRRWSQVKLCSSPSSRGPRNALGLGCNTVPARPRPQARCVDKINPPGLRRHSPLRKLKPTATTSAPPIHRLWSRFGRARRSPTPSTQAPSGRQPPGRPRSALGGFDRDVTSSRLGQFYFMASKFFPPSQPPSRTSATPLFPTGNPSNKFVSMPKNFSPCFFRWPSWSGLTARVPTSTSLPPWNHVLSNPELAPRFQQRPPATADSTFPGRSAGLRL